MLGPETVGEYRGCFTEPEKAFERAIEERRFEIELYWKRAAYFWTFIGAVFAGYFVLEKSQVKEGGLLSVFVACLGFLFSLGWYLANRGSKYWLELWQHQVELLEEHAMGPLYKCRLARSEYKWCSLNAYPFSVTRINTLLAIIVCVAWAVLLLRTFFERLLLVVAFSMAALVDNDVLLLCSVGAYLIAALAGAVVVVTLARRSSDEDFGSRGGTPQQMDCPLGIQIRQIAPGLLVGQTKGPEAGSAGAEQTKGPGAITDSQSTST